jgi:hypothetical protein
MNRTSTQVPLWRIDCEQFRKLGSFELLHVNTEAHETFIKAFIAENDLNHAREGSTITFLPAKRNEKPRPSNGE